MKPARAILLYLLVACFPVAASVAAHEWFAGWLAQEWTYHEDCCCGLHGEAIPLTGYLGGSQSEVYSHWLDLWGCSGVFLVVLWLMVGERLVRGRKSNAGFGSWTFAAGSAFVLWNWARLTMLDAGHGEGTFLVSCVLFFAPLFALALPMLLRRGSRQGADRLFYRGVAAMAIGMPAAQGLFEPSGTGGPNVLAWAFAGGLWALDARERGIGWGSRFGSVRRDAALRELRAKGFDWVRPSDAAFVLRHLEDASAVANRENLAGRAGYVEGDIRSVVLLSIYPQPTARPTP